MVFGLLGLQPQAVACPDGQLNAGLVSARLEAKQKPIMAQIVNENWLLWVGESVQPLLSDKLLGLAGVATLYPFPLFPLPRRLRAVGASTARRPG
jgi:hypothetical protein